MPIGASARPMVACSGFYGSHKPPSSGDAPSILMPHRDGHQNGQQRGYILHLILLIVALVAAGAIWSK